VKEAVQEKPFSLSTLLNRLLSFSLSEKFKFAVKTSLSIVLAYLIAFAQGWDSGSTAAITIMLIASSGSIAESVTVGLKRVIGTAIGAAAGIGLIAIFPQDREWYLLTLSVFVTVVFYLRRAYRGDATIFFLTGLTMMIVFYDGNAHDSFLYGVNRTFMIILGITIFTFISIFLWPVKEKDGTMDRAVELLETEAELYRKRDAQRSERKTLYTTLQSKEEALKASVFNAATENETLSREQRNTIMQNIKKIDETLMLLSYNNEAHFADRYNHFVKNFKQADEEIQQLFASLKSAIIEEKEIDIPSEWKADYNNEAIFSLSHIDRAELTATILDIKKLHDQLRDLARKFNAIFSPYPTQFELSREKTSAFNWLDMEDMKGSLVTFLIFWATVVFWIIFNPPAGFLIATLATALSVQTTFSPIKPSLLIILLSFSFIFAAVMYILVLPNIHYGWELGLFLFFYSFIGFYFINPQISIFFLLGMGVLELENPMVLSFQLFMMILLIFYLFLFVLLLFYYIPFSTKPEVLFRVMKQRFFRLSANLLKRSNNLLAHRGSFLGKMKAWYAYKHLMHTVKKMQLWADKIDTQYFDTIDRETLLTFTKECETFAYLIKMLYAREIDLVDNVLIQRFKDENRIITLADVMEHYANGMKMKQLDSQWRDPQKIIDAIEAHMTDFFSRMKSDKYSQEDVIRFYELIALRRNVWVSFSHCQRLMEKLDFKILERSRF